VEMLSINKDVLDNLLYINPSPPTSEVGKFC
jgi:hypothetical protein